MRSAFLIALLIGFVPFASISLSDTLNEPTIQKIVQSKSLQAQIDQFVFAGQQSGLIAITTSDLSPEDAENTRKFMVQLWEKNKEALERVHAEDLARRFTETERDALAAFFENETWQGALEKFGEKDVAILKGYHSVVEASEVLLKNRIANLKNE